MKILLIRRDHLGDLVLTTPLIRALAKDGNEVDLMIPRWLVSIPEGNPFVRETFAVEDIVPQFPVGWRSLARWIRAREYDCILLPNPRRPEIFWASLISGVRKRLALNAGLWGRLTFHRCLRIREAFMQGRHFSDVQLDLARALQVPTDGLTTDYFCRKDEVLEARRKIKSIFPDFGGEPIIGIHPGCAGNTCNLPSAVYGDIATLLLERTNCRIIVTGSDPERALLESWPEKTVKSPRLHVGMGEFGLRALAAIISQFSNYVIVGTGPLHLAGALGIRTTSPFCAVPPLRFSNWGNMNGRGACVHPEPERCQAWIDGGNPYSRCHFRGEITAEDFWPLLKESESPTTKDDHEPA